MPAGRGGWLWFARLGLCACVPLLPLFFSPAVGAGRLPLRLLLAWLCTLSCLLVTPIGVVLQRGWMERTL